MLPDTADWNFIPTSMAFASLAMGGAVLELNTVHGQAMVVSDQLAGDITVPEVSAAPLTVAVSVAFWARLAFGRNLATDVVVL